MFEMFLKTWGMKKGKYSPISEISSMISHLMYFIRCVVFDKIQEIEDIEEVKATTSILMKE